MYACSIKWQVKAVPPRAAFERSGSGDRVNTTPADGTGRALRKSHPSQPIGLQLFIGFISDRPITILDVAPTHTDAASAHFKRPF